MKRIAASLIVLAATSSAYAFEFSGDMYVVGSLGRVGINQTDIQVDNNNILLGAAPTVAAVPGLSATLQDLHSTQTTSRNAFKLQLGYEFSPNFAVEGGYISLGKTEYSATYNSRITVTGLGIPVGALRPGTQTQSNKISGWNAAGVGIYPINNSFSLFAKLGMIYAKVKSSSAGNGDFTTTNESDDSKAKAYYGVGATYYPLHDRNLGIRAEYERFSKIGDSGTTGSSDINLMTVGVSSKF